MQLSHSFFTPAVVWEKSTSTTQDIVQNVQNAVVFVGLKLIKMLHMCFAMQICIF